MTPFDLEGQEVDERVALPMLTPDARRAERVRQSCHAVLARRRRKVSALPSRSIWNHRLRVVAVATISTAWVLYVSSLLMTAFNLERFLR